MILATLLFAAAVAAATPPPASIDDVGPMPCAPGVIRPRSATTPIPVLKPSAVLEEEEREVAEMRTRTDEFERAADEAVRIAWDREQEAVRAKYLRRSKPLSERERTQREAAIAEFKAFVARRGQAPAAAEATYRLAELQFEEASDLFTTAHGAWEQARSNAAPDAPAPGPEPKPDYTDAIASYRTLVSWFDGFGKKDGALYMIAFCLGEMGNAKGARDTFEELASKVPDSEYAAEAWLRVGEYHFDRNQLWPAIDAYGHATGHPASPFYDKALYKLAWSWYRLADASHPAAWEQSARVFARLLDAAPGSELRGEALQYLALIYADHGGLAEVDRAIAGRSWHAEVFPALAQVWFEEGSWAEAAEAFRLSLADAPEADEAPSWLHRRALCLLRAGRAAEATAAREELHRRFGTGSPWAEAHAGRPAVVASAAALAEPALLQAATFAHSRAQESGAEADYLKAGELYGEYLRRYPGRSSAYDIAFERAECLYYARRFAEAADAYGDVLPGTGDDRWLTEAAFSRVKAREKLLGATPSSDEPAADAATVPVDPADRTYASAVEDFTCVAPTDWRLPEALFRSAQIYFHARRLPAARARAEAVVAASPKLDLGAFAADLVIDAWRLEGNWAEVESAAKRFLALDLGHSTAVRDATRTALTRVALTAGYRVAEELEAKGKHSEAAARFLALADANPHDEVAPQALFAAGDLFERVGSGGAAADVFKRLARDYPDSPLSGPAAFRNARALERILLLGQAADAYAEYARRYPRGADATAAGWNIAVLLEASGRFADAAASWEHHADLHRTAEDAFEARLHAAEDWTRAGKTDRSLKAWRALAGQNSLGGPQAVLALAGLARAERAAKIPSDGETRRALEAQGLLLARNGSTPESARAAARAGLAKADDITRAFQGVVVHLPEARLRSGLRVKHELLDSLEETLLAVASAGDADAATEALFRLGEAYAAYAKAVLDAPAPNGASAKARADWRGKAVATAEPFQDKAAAAFRHDLDLASRAGVVTPWTRKAEAGLAALLPDEAKAPREDASPLPPADVWAIPEMVLPSSPRLAEAAPVVPASRAAELSAEVEAWLAADKAGDRRSLPALAKRMEATATAVANEPPSPLREVAWLDLGLARERLADHAGAVIAFENALEADHELFPAAAGVVAALARGGDPQTAAATANDWLSHHPKDAAVRTNLAGAEHLLGNDPLALDTAIGALAFDSNFGTARRAAVACALAAHHIDFASFAARQAVALFPDDPRAAEALGRMLRISAEERIYGRAAGREELLAAATRWPDDPRLSHAAGVALLEDGDAKRALPLLERAAPREGEPEGWIALAAARRANGDAAPAAQAADEALAIRPNDRDALKNRGLAAADAGDFAGAEAAFKAYLEKTEGARSETDPVAGWLEDAKAREKTREGTP